MISTIVLLLAALPQSTLPILPQTTLPIPLPQSTLPSLVTYSDPYAAAYARALRENKPLVVWVGGNFCDRCVGDSKDDFVHHFVPDGWKGQQGPATVIYVPHDAGLWRAGTVTRWTVGSHDWGHVPSVRRVLAEWREQVRSGNRDPLRLLDFGDGSWGMSHEAFYRNYRGVKPSGYHRSGTSMQPRYRSGGC